MAASTSVSPDLLAKYEPVIGLEVHVQLLTNTKAFCGCANRFGGSPNTHICPVCLGLPGSLPVLNRQAVEFAALAAMALHSEVRPRSVFARKNYRFYPDLPQGLSGFRSSISALAEHGWIDVPARDANGNAISKRIGITRLHMEEDAGKEQIHDGLPDSETKTYVDLNRCGTPLIEIVMASPISELPDEAFEYLTRLKEILLFTGVSDCNMEEGSLRCRCQRERVRAAARTRRRSLAPKPKSRTWNSFRFIRSALEFEIERQFELIERGGRVTQETRLWKSRPRAKDLFHALQRAGARLPLFP